MKRVATRETIVRIPVVIEPVEIEVPAVVVPVEVRHVTLAIVIALIMQGYRLCHVLLNTLEDESDSESLYSLIPRTKYFHFLISTAH